MSAVVPPPAPRPANHLAGETSPYLLQHLHNPVDWYPWGEVALARARTEQKLIFLSIGYSTCHWCHVMAHESFEDAAVADLLNRDYVAIKVDREERPDLDQVYMEVCQQLTGSGGWPLTLLLTPGAIPFYAATYLPKTARSGRPGLLQLLPWMAAQWREQPQALAHSGQQLLAALQPQATPAPAVTTAVFQQACLTLRQTFDARHGGFGPAPKFPRPHSLTFLLRRYRRSGDPSLLQMAELTLLAMRRGGVYDQLGGGFHRYATDAGWLLPHFEKMLYDQAGLAQAYLEAYQLTGGAIYAETAREIFAYLQRDLAAPEGAFYAAEDADSEGVEGKFYVWRAEELEAVLGPVAAARFGQVYGVTAAGNYRDEASGRATGSNILHQPQPLDRWAGEWGLSATELARELHASAARLLAARRGRVRPHRDDKILTSWNGLAIAALAQGGQVLGEPDYLNAAVAAAEFMLQRLVRSDGRLLRCDRPEAPIPAFAEDYAGLARGLLELYAATLDPLWLARARHWAGELARLFRAEDGGLYATGCDAEELVLRPRSAYDGALPAASSLALEVYARLGLLTGEGLWRERAEGLLGAVAAELLRYPAGYTQLLQGVAWLLDPTREVVIVGEAQAPDTLALVAALRHSYMPDTVFLLRAPATAPALDALAPWVAGLEPVHGRATAYLCQDDTCQAPLTAPDRLRELLAQPPGP